MSWPTSSDLQDYLAAGGVTMPDGSAVSALVASDALIGAAVTLFEESTGWVPFIGDTQTRYFDPPGYPINGLGSWGGGGVVLKLGAGLISVSSLTIAGVTKTENTDFWLIRGTRPDMPAFAIRFRLVVYGNPRDIAITGEWGRMADSDDLANQAVLNLAAQMACRSIVDGFRSVPSEQREADVAEKWDADNIASIGEGFGAVAAPLIQVYKRKTVGV